MIHWLPDNRSHELLPNLSTTKILADEENIGFVFMVGHPTDSLWDGVCLEMGEALKAIEEIGCSKELFGITYTGNRQGPFMAIPNGVSFGGGQTVKLSYA